jgi:hypothetical protein
VAAAEAWVIATDATDFQDAYAFAPNMESSIISGNGDDLFLTRGDGTKVTHWVDAGEFGAAAPYAALLVVVAAIPAMILSGVRSSAKEEL